MNNCLFNHMKSHNNIPLQIKKTEKSLNKENPDLGKKFGKLMDLIKEYKSGIVAFSGGGDSSLLALLGHHLLVKSLCVTADSPTLPRSELSEAKKFAKQYHLDHRVVLYNELEDENFVKNDEKRCFICKNGLFKILNDIKEREGYDCVMDGSNFDDLNDFRPGRKAAEKNNVISPFEEAELGKEEIRIISRKLDLSNWDKPQMACLSSRFPRNVRINKEDLKKVERAEELIKKVGYKDVRVRFHNEIARIELGRDEKIDLNKLRNLVPKIKKLGFKYITLDLEGYRTGSLNE